MMRLLVLLLLCFLPMAVLAQSTSQLSFETYLSWIKAYHPVSKQAELVVKQGKARLQQARGGFDPILEGQTAKKDFDGKNYYVHEQYGLRVPTWFGIEVLGEYDRGQGVFLDPMRSTPADGLYRAGLSMPVGAGLFIDKRRAELRKGQIYRDAALVERQAMLNDLMYEAGKAYWEWAQAYAELQVYQQAYDISNDVLKGVILAARYGDRAAVDTLEALIQRDNWAQRLREGQMKYFESGYALSVFLWTEDGLPLELKPEVTPDSLSAQLRLPTFNADFINNHPEYRLYDFKLQQLNIERRLALEYLKPKIDLKYYALNQTTRPELTPFQGQQTGISVRFPLFLRSERGQLNIIRLSTASTSWEQDLKANELKQKQLRIAMQKEQLDELARTQIGLVGQTILLLDAEKTRFSTGESSIFILNQREVAVVNTRLKLLEMQMKRQKNVLEQWWILGNMADY